MPSPGRPARPRSLAAQVLALQVVVVLVVVLVGLALAYVDARRDQVVAARDRAVAVALAVADSPEVVTAVTGPDPAATMQPYAEQIRRDTGTDFVVVMSHGGIRYSHPDPANIGKPFRGSTVQALNGEVYTEQYTSTLGPSVRAVVPVRSDGAVVALVSVGITLEAVNRSVVASLPGIGLAALAVLGVGLAGAAPIGRRLRRQTHGLDAVELTRMYEYYDAVLHSVREGLLLLDAEGRVQLVNDEARRLLRTHGPVEGRPVRELALPPDLAAAVVGRDELTDEIHLVDDRMLVVNRTRARWHDTDLGAVVTLRDHTELQAVSGELDSVRALADSLRSQDHESANRLHTVVSLIEMGRSNEAVEFATAGLATAQRLTDRVVLAVREPVVAALLLGKSATAAERGVELVVDPGSRVDGLPVEPQHLVTLLGNLVDNAIDATAESDRPRRVDVAITSDAERLHLVVADSGPGLTPDQCEQAFRRGWSTKTGPRQDGPVGGRGIGLALMASVVRRYDGRLEVATSDLGGARFELTVGAGVPT